jgi:ribonucleoside-diphosphate reductase alpha chain
MRKAKSGQWWVDNGQRALANNSVCYTEKPDLSSFLNEWSSLYESKSGERGVFSRVASNKQAAKNGRREPCAHYGTNPCSEIILRPNQFCNLSEIVVRPTDTLDDLKRKAKQAAILGTLQASLTDFRYLRSCWKKNTEEEALLGVSLTGIMDHPVLSMADDLREGWLGDWLRELKEVVIETNKDWAKKIGILPSAAVTAVKPSGTVSQLVDSASGIHPRFSPYYRRTVRASVGDPLAQWMMEKGVECEPDVTNPANLVFSFPMKAPEESVCVEDVSAMEQLKLWKIYQDHWCEHKPSITVYYNDDEFMEIGAWLYKHFDDVSGVSFLPKSDHTYAQAPYQEITEEEYNEMVEAMPDLDWAESGVYEATDNTESSQTLACVGGACEL